MKKTLANVYWTGYKYWDYTFHPYIPAAPIDQEVMKKSTLVVHMDDPTTRFLELSYKGDFSNIVGHNVLEGTTVTELITLHERTICMGHGSPGGMFGRTEHYVIGPYADDLAALRPQVNNVYVWCNANQFIEAHDLHGFYTGMIISEVQEAEWMGVKNFTAKDVFESNVLFTLALRETIRSKTPLETMKSIYNVGYRKEHNPVVAYNQNNLFFR